jgi:hypothetical protein
MISPPEKIDWSAVTARCLAYLCLKNSPFADASLLSQAQFLEKLGLPLEEQAGVVGSTVASLRELARQARAKKHPKKLSRHKAR